jgi:hypothetical protein
VGIWLRPETDPLSIKEGISTTGGKEWRRWGVVASRLLRCVSISFPGAVGSVLLTRVS